MDIEKYLERIDYSGPLEPELEVLKNLQKKHLLNIPFENLDIHNNISIELSIDRIFEKIVHQKRGGFCYELNGLFFELLSALGFEAKRISARVYEADTGYSNDFDHLAIIVSLDNVEYLSDVGFGEFTFAPLELYFGVTQHDERGDFFMDKLDNGYLRVNKLKDGRVIPQYIFKNEKRELPEFEAMCRYHQTSPESHFTTKKLISRPTENGRISLTGKTLKITEANSVKEVEIENEASFNKYLKELF